MKVVILQSNYIPWKGYFDLINEADVFVFYDEVKYTKRDWRNRNKIYNKNGLHWLTIPVDNSFANNKISEVVIDSEWQETHFRSLYMGYRAAPYFHQLEPLIEDYLHQKKWTSLKELNHYLIIKISEMLGITTRFVDSATLNLDGDRVQRLVNICTQLGATEYISGPAAEEYLKDSHHLFHEKNLKLSFKSYPVYPTYKQMAEPFEHAVSILDLIAHIELSQIKKYIWDF
ncbi:MAG TPA: WbqC family protein [Bacteroidia bacterium]|nr:WbqC family protein [Bacteroidia bacterium]HRH09558.1 WbqC family protein [Bacteroidia bacterium]HRH64486.1 WbqC family protein [Bacteroidia bacterium]